MIWKILGLFVNPLTANEKYSHLNRGNLLQHFEMPFSQKRKKYSPFFFFFAFYKFRFTSLLNRGNLLQHILMHLSQKRKTVSDFFFLHFLKLDSIFNILKKYMTLIADVFLNWRTPKNVVRHMSKKSLSEDPSTSNMVKGSKLCSRLNDSTFTIFIDFCGGNSGWKSLLERYGKSLDCLLSHWLLMTSILFLTEAIISETKNFYWIFFYIF